MGLLHASPTGGEHAHAALVEVLRTMSAVPGPAASLRVAFSRKRLDAAGQATDPALREELRGRVAALVAAVNRAASPEPPR